MFTKRTCAAIIILVGTLIGCSTSTNTASETASTLTAAPTSVAADGTTTTTLTVTAKNSSGGPVASLAVALTGSTTANVFTPATGTTSASGVFTATLSSTSAGADTVTATLGSGTSAVTLTTVVTFTATAPSQTNSTFAANPTTLTADGTTTTTLTVTLEDADKNPVGNQKVTFTSTGTGDTFTPASGSTSAAGVLTATLSSTSAGTDTVTATAGSLALTATVTFTAGAPSSTNSSVTAASPTLVADGTSTDAITATVLDANGNPVEGASVTFSGSGSGDVFTPASGTTAADGTVTSSLTTTTSGVDTITATIGSVTVTTTVTTSAGAFSASNSSITANPTSALANGTAVITLTVIGKDVNGNPLAGASVTLSLGGTGSSLSSSTGVLDATGSFSSMLTSKVAETETVTAAIGAPTNTVSTSVTFNPGAGTAAVFTSNPTSTVAGVPFAPVVSVALEDQFGNVANDSTTVVTLSLGTGANGAVLTGTTTATAVNGVAAFPGLSVAKAGLGYTLVINATGYTGTPSSTFNITAGAMSMAAFTVPPSTTVAGATITPAVVVALEDALGNPILTDSTTQVTLTIGTGTGTLLGTTTATAVAGLATFNTLSIQQVGSYTLSAAATGYANATSPTFGITEGAMANAVFTTEPSTVTAGVAFSPTVTVTLQDQFANTITTDSTTAVTVAFGTNPSGATLLGTTTVTAVNGVASFPDLNTQQAGAGYTLTAMANNYATGTSTAFTVTAGAMGGVAFTTQPTSSTAGATIPTVVVNLEDVFGNTILTDSSTPVTISIGANPNGGTLSGTLTITPAAGVATFGDLSIATAGVGYTLMAAANNYSGATSAAFNITAGAVAGLGFSAPPTGAPAGVTFAPVVVNLVDAFGNTVLTDSTTQVTISIATGSGPLLGTLTVTDVNGVATFSDLSVQTADSYTFVVSTNTGFSSAPTSPFSVTPGGPANAVFSGEPTQTVAGATIAPITVTLQDEYGNTITSDSTTTVSLAVNLGGTTLFGTTTQTAVNGIATFGDLSIVQTGSWTLSITDTGGYVGDLSTPFTITAGAPANVAFTTEPVGTTAGVTLAAVAVSLEDQFQNVITSDSSTVVSLTIATGTGPLLGVTSTAVSNGVATFTGLSIDVTYVGYTLVASAPNYQPAASTPFTIVAGSGTKVVFTVGPTNTTAGSPFTPALQATLEDTFGNAILTDSATAISLSVTSGSGALVGTTTQAVSNGVATFPGLKINQAGTGYVLTATAAGYTAGASSAFNIAVGAPAGVGFTVEPSNTTGGIAWTPAVQVAIQDIGGNTVTSSTATIGIVLGANPGSGTLAGTVSKAAVSGVATFTGLSINKAGTGYTLVASSSGLTNGTSSTFNITVGAGTALAFTVEPSNGTAGTAWSPATQITVLDAGGNTVTTSTASISIAIGTNPGGGALSGTTTVAAVAGVATFTGVSINKAGTSYTLTATGTGLTSAASTGFNITAGAKSTVAFTTEPTTGIAGADIPVKVSLEDAQGNVITTDSSTVVTLAIGTNPGGSTLSGPTATAVNGVATFAATSLNKAGPGYTLTASAPGYATGATSTAFSITAGAKAVAVFTTEPTSTTAGTAFGVTVTLEDAFGNTITTDSSTAVSLSISTNPGGGSLSGTTTVTASSGVTAFTTISLNKAGTGYVLLATATGYGSGTSSAFNITAGAKANAVFTVEPASAAAGVALSPAVVVTLEDGFGNIITTDSSTSVTVSIATNPGGGSLSGTATLTAASGVATFSTLNINNVGTGYTLAITASGYTGATSTSFSISAGAKSKAVFTTEPGNGSTSTAFSPAPVVTLEDVFGNTITSDSSTAVTISIGTNPGAGTLGGTVTVVASSGVATFSTLTINNAGTGYTLVAAASGYTSVTSSAFNVTTSAPSGCVTTTVAGVYACISNNLATTYTGSVSVGCQTCTEKGLVNACVDLPSCNNPWTPAIVQELTLLRTGFTCTPTDEQGTNCGWDMMTTPYAGSGTQCPTPEACTSSINWQNCQYETPGEISSGAYMFGVCTQ